MELNVDWTLRQAELGLVMARAGGGMRAGLSGHSGRAGLSAMADGAQIERAVEAAVSRAERRRAQNEANGKALPLKGLIPGMAVHYARCCHPLPGDAIVGIVTTGKGVTVHVAECATLLMS